MKIEALRWRTQYGMHIVQVWKLAHPMKSDSQIICTPSATEAPACFEITTALSDEFRNEIPCIFTSAFFPLISMNVPPPSSDAKMHACPFAHKIDSFEFNTIGGSSAVLTI